MRGPHTAASTASPGRISAKYTSMRSGGSSNSNGSSCMKQVSAARGTDATRSSVVVSV